MALNDELKRIILKAVAETKSRQTLEDVKDYVVDQINLRTRTGKGVAKPEGKASRLKKIEPKTKRNRRLLKKSGRLSGETTPAKSNLTSSGQMLDSLKGKVNTAKSEVEVTLDKEGQRKATEVQKIDPLRFTFMNLSKGETKQVIEILDERVERLGRKLR